MRANPIIVTLPQLLDRYRAASTGDSEGELNDLIRLTYHSTPIVEFLHTQLLLVLNEGIDTLPAKQAVE